MLVYVAYKIQYVYLFFILTVFCWLIGEKRIDVIIY